MKIHSSGGCLGLSLSLSEALTLIFGLWLVVGAVLPAEGVPEANTITQLFQVRKTESF